MTTAGEAAPSEQGSRRLSDAQLKEVMRLIKGANSVELKLTVPVAAHRATIQGLPLDPVEAQPRQVYFFDTPDLRLYRAGVVVRARRIQGGKGDTVVKLRPVEPDTIPQDLKNDPSFNIEVDALPGGFVCSASFKGRSSGQDIRDAISGKRRLSKIFSKSQRAFYRLHAPLGLELDDLQALGPTFILKGRFDAPMGIDGHAGPRSIVAEVWLYPDGSRILELSTKCLPNEALATAAETRAYLVDKGVPTNAAQETKTLMALQFYSKALQAELAAQEAAEKSAARRPAAAKPAAAKKAATKSTTKSSAPAKSTAARTSAAKTSAAKPAATKAPAKASAAKPAAAKPAAAKSAGTRARTTRRASTTTARTTRSSAAKPAASGTRRTTTRRTPPKTS